MDEWDNVALLISAEDGEAVAYALWKLQDRGKMFVTPGDKLYAGMIIGIHSRDNDLVVNPIKEKKLTNVRNTGHDDAQILTPPRRFTIESALEWIEADELLEVTPKSLRMRKRMLKEVDRRRDSRNAKKLEKDAKISEDELTDSEAEVQKLTDKAVAEIEKVVGAKEAELMKV